MKRNKPEWLAIVIVTFFLILIIVILIPYMVLTVIYVLYPEIEPNTIICFDNYGEQYRPASWDGERDLDNYHFSCCNTNTNGYKFPTDCKGIYKRRSVFGNEIKGD